MSNTGIVSATLLGLMGKDLTHFKIEWVYWAEVDHGLMGTFPAIVNHDKGYGSEARPVITRSTDLLDEVIRLCDAHHYKPHAVHKIVALVDIIKGTAIMLDGINSKMLDKYPEDWDKEEIRLLTREESDALQSKGEHPFRWAPGIF